MNLRFVFKDYKFLRRYHIYFLFFEISNPNFTLLSKSEIYYPRNTVATPRSQIRNINFPKLNYKFCFRINPKRTSYRRARHSLGEVKLYFTFWPKARDRQGLNTKILVPEGGCVDDVSLRHIGAVPTGHLERARESAKLQPRHPSHSPQPGTGNRSVKWLALRWLQTTARLDFSRPQVVCNSSKIERKGGGSAGWCMAGLLMKICQKVSLSNCHFWGHIRSSKRFGRRLCRNRYF